MITNEKKIELKTIFTQRLIQIKLIIIYNKYINV